MPRLAPLPVEIAQWQPLQRQVLPLDEVLEGLTTTAIVEHLGHLMGFLHFVWVARVISIARFLCLAPVSSPRRSL